MEILFLVLNFNNNAGEIRNNLDNTDMRKWVMYRSNLEIWISKNSTDRKSKYGSLMRDSNWNNVFAWLCYG